MTENELLLLEIAMFSRYVESRKLESGLAMESFAEQVNVSKGEISKIIGKKRKSVSLHSFYNIAVNSGDTIENATNAVYTHRSLELKTSYTLEKRTNFGLLMRDLFEGQNTFEVIQAKTGISKQRLTDLYFNTSAPEPFEMLLIEKAVGKNPGDLMKEYVERFPVKKVRE